MPVVFRSLVVSLACAWVPAVSLASVPQSGSISDDTALYQRISEINIRKELSPNFDGDLVRLSAAQARFREDLPSLARHPRVAAPMQRIGAQPYQAGGSRVVPAARK